MNKKLFRMGKAFRDGIIEGKWCLHQMLCPYDRVGDGGGETIRDAKVTQNLIKAQRVFEGAACLPALAEGVG